MPRKKRKYKGPRCRRCRCTNRRACPGGCFWIEPDLCSACFKKSVIKKMNCKKALEILRRYIFVETAMMESSKRMITIREAYNFILPLINQEAQCKQK